MVNGEFRSKKAYVVNLLDSDTQLFSVFLSWGQREESLNAKNIPFESYDP